MKKDYIVLIIDDDASERLKLVNSLKAIDGIGEIFIAEDSDSGESSVLNHRPDLLFLDIEMPHKNGIDLLRELKDLVHWPMQVVFYTAYDQYMLQAIRESVFDYLLKPYEDSELLLVINRFLYLAESEQGIGGLLRESLDQLEKNHSHFLITTVRGYRSLRVEDVGYFEYDKASRHWFAFLETESVQLKRKTSASDILSLADDFIQINQQQIVNLSYLKATEGRKCLLFEPFHCKKDLTISRNFFNSVQDRFFIM